MPFDDYIKKQLLLLPDSPGVYQFFNAEGVIIYVGKAKNLKRRVSSYFNKVHDSVKTNILVKHIRDIKYIVVSSEKEALLLENNFIKKYQPRYNILLKDDKSYLLVVNVEKKGMVYPMIPAGATVTNILLGE